MTKRPRALNPVDVLVLRAVNRFRYLTAAQLNRLLWPDNTRDGNRYAQRRLRQLAQDDYLLPLRKLPRPATGTAPRVHALGWRGRKVLLELGEVVPSYYRPSELSEASRNAAFMPHTLAVIDVLIAAERLTHDFPDVVLSQLWTERTLRQLAPRVAVPGVRGYAPSQQVTVVPDAVFSLTVAGATQDFVLEVDRGTERQPVWRRKVAALTSWIASPASKDLLLSDYVTAMVVTSSPRRQEYLRTWTAQELVTRSLFEEYAGMFKISSASPVALTPEAFFAEEHWHPPYIGEPDSLVDLSACQPVLLGEG